MGGQDVAEVGAIEYVFKRGEDSNPYRGTPCAWDESKVFTNQLYVGGLRRSSLCSNAFRSNFLAESSAEAATGARKKVSYPQA